MKNVQKKQANVVVGAHAHTEGGRSMNGRLPDVEASVASHPLRSACRPPGSWTIQHVIELLCDVVMSHVHQVRSLRPNTKRRARRGRQQVGEEADAAFMHVAKSSQGGSTAHVQPTRALHLERNPKPHVFTQQGTFGASKLDKRVVGI